MPNKKNTNKDQQEPVNQLTELEQLRFIVFGEAQKKLDNQLNTLRNDLDKGLKTQQETFSDHLSKIKESTQRQFSDLETRLQRIDSTHDDNENNLQKCIDDMASEHEMFATATQQDFKNIEQSLDNESASLASHFNEQLEQLKIYLEEVSKDLSSSKTDRKTLAKLLATMATNLQDDPL